jgi:type I restriction enzyme S subunit
MVGETALSGKYTAYPEYKNSGVEWLGDVPISWNVLPIKRLSKIFNGSTPKSGEQLYWEGDIPWVTPADLGKTSSPYIERGLRNITIEGYDSCGTSLVPTNTVLLSSRAPIGTLGIAAKSLCTNQGCKSIVVNKANSHKFIYYVLLSSTKQLNLLGRGTTFLELSSDELGSYKVACPSEVAQQKIANFLDHETAKIDTLIDKQQKLITLLKEKRQAVISHAVTKGLPSVTGSKAPMRDSGVEWLGDIPKHWEALQTKRFFSLECYPAPNNNDMELLSVYTSIGVRPRKDLEQKGNKASTTDGYWLVKKGDLIVNKLLAWMGAVGYSDYDGVTSPAYDILRKRRPLNVKFYHYLFRSKIAQSEFKRWSRGIMEMRLRLYFEELGRITMPFPPEKEQNEIVEEIEKLETQYDGIIDKANCQIELLQERRTALISAAVTGKIDVRNWQVPQASNNNKEVAV